ncbi:hypothetical protein PSQ40_12000 [Curvibacter sp. HBC61]|uniref:Uncharacterized protein n=1 Tax=Curvibacter cyanobacteriorum TaxID=3026422 RepID=A0ABT5MZN8_9BURK|nr:hypothetical protein [Curvibacter sp. HBC61]MDD0839297.1 hypothetical protein [Curvibacter sp. HBC61]
MENQELADYQRLGGFLDRCSAFDSEVEGLLQDGWTTSSTRHVVAMGFCKAAFEHGVSQRLLVSEGLYGTALSLIRLHFETTVRAAWVLYAASESWLKDFTALVPTGSLKEPSLGPPIPAMLDAIEPHDAKFTEEGRRLFQTVKVMHSFVHGGVHLVVHALRGYPPAKLIDVLRNRNLMSLTLCNVIVVASGKQALYGSVGRLSRSYMDIMPPMLH